MKYLGGDYGTRGKCRIEKSIWTGRLKRIVVSGRLFCRWKIKAKDIVKVQEVNESNKVNVLGAIGGGIVGGLLTGGIGILAGSILAGRGKKYIVLIRDRQDRKLLCAVKQKEYELLLGATVGKSVSKDLR
jgi:hypothetical protein